MKPSRRAFLKTGTIASAGALLTVNGTLQAAKEVLNLLPHATLFELPPLGYPYDALEPFIDAQTMVLHHDKHHQAYVTKLNEAIEKDPSLHHQSIEQLFAGMGKWNEASTKAVRNQGGGHWNHTFFWTILKTGTAPSPLLDKAISKQFGSMDAFKTAFEKAALGVFGSGWVWLVKTPQGTLEIVQTANQDNPLMPDAKVKGKPIIGLDVWEHAYYLKYQNKRADYVKAFWNILNWNKVGELYGLM